MRITESHEWIDLNGQIGTVGITEEAKRELGEIVFVELPPIGKQVVAGEGVCVLESTKAAVDIYTPVSGKIVAINDALKKSPSLLQSADPEIAWLFRLELTDLAEWDALALT